MLPTTEVDHRIPKAEGGTGEPYNLCAINVECHKRKTAKESGRARLTAKRWAWPRASRIVSWRAAAAVCGTGRGSAGGGRVNFWAEGRQYHPFRLFLRPRKMKFSGQRDLHTF